MLDADMMDADMLDTDMSMQTIFLSLNEWNNETHSYRNFVCRNSLYFLTENMISGRCLPRLLTGPLARRSSPSPLPAQRNLWWGLIYLILDLAQCLTFALPPSDEKTALGFINSYPVFHVYANNKTPAFINQSLFTLPDSYLCKNSFNHSRSMILLMLLTDFALTNKNEIRPRK